MTKIVACIDGSVYSQSVVDHAAWAAQRINASIELLQVLGRREASSTDLSGNIAAGAQQQLLEDLARLDAERARLIQMRGRMLLEEGKARLAAAGITDATTQLRHGDLLLALAEREPTDLFVIGKRGEAANFATAHLGSNLERVVRSIRSPILVASRGFNPIQKALVAFDGGSSVMKAIDHLSRSRLMDGVALHLVHVGAETPEIRRQLEGAVAQMKGAGHAAEYRFLQGAPEKVIAGIVDGEGMNLLVMGAYSHSRIRTLFIGSTTTELMRLCRVPVLLYR